MKLSTVFPSASLQGLLLGIWNISKHRTNNQDVDSGLGDWLSKYRENSDIQRKLWLKKRACFHSRGNEGLFNSRAWEGKRKQADMKQKLREREDFWENDLELSEDLDLNQRMVQSDEETRAGEQV